MTPILVASAITLVPLVALIIGIVTGIRDGGYEGVTAALLSLLFGCAAMFAIFIFVSLWTWALSTASF